MVESLQAMLISVANEADKRKVPLKYTLRRYHINSQGYDSGGGYFGTGQPLYWYCSDNQVHHGYLRALNREDAKRKIRSQYLNQKIAFYN
jgi:hypothetical protein